MSNRKTLHKLVIKFMLPYGLKIIVYLSFIFILIITESCNGRSYKYHDGEPVILKKEYSLIPGVCVYTYVGYGRKETFEDKCDKYSVGDKLSGNKPSVEQDSINTKNE